MRVEERVDLTRSCGTLDGYRELLTRMLGLHAALEASLAQLDWAGSGIDLAERRKSGLIRADLASLGAPTAVPAQAGAPVLRSLAEGVGCLYVIEGSTLGGKIILRHVGASLGLDAARGASFFASYGAEVGAMWRAFGEAACAHCSTEARIGEAVAAATHTFEAFARGLGPPASPWSAEQEMV